jgi:hypothetical protein
MLRTIEDREVRQRALRDQQTVQIAFEEEHRELLDLGEAARALKVSRATARRLLRNEPGVNLICTPGSRRPMIRIERSVIDRILRRTANRFQR